MARKSAVGAVLVQHAQPQEVEVDGHSSLRFFINERHSSEILGVMLRQVGTNNSFQRFVASIRLLDTHRY